MSIFKSLFGQNKEEKEKLQRELEEKERFQRELEEKEKLQKELEEKERLQKEEYILLLKQIDSDGNGFIDLVEGDEYGKILKLNQDKIIEINRDYVKQFVQVLNYLKSKRISIQNVYQELVKCINEGGVKKSLDFGLEEYLPESKLQAIKVVKDATGWSLSESKKYIDDICENGTFNSHMGYFKKLDRELIKEYIQILNDDSHLFNLLLINSIAMVQSLVNDDMITFYEIYEKFDQLNMFDSKHEKDIKNMLSDINNGLDNIMNEIQRVGNNIVSSIGELGLITEESSKLISDGLNSVNSSIQANNFLTSIQTYQMYKINKNIKGLKG
jgi:ribosomal protein L7/L12